MVLRQFGAAAAVAVTLAFATTSAHAVTEIQWWHAMTGGNNDIVNKLAEDFNASQSDYKVVPSAMTLETGSADRVANMHMFAATALNFLLQNLSR